MKKILIFFLFSAVCLGAGENWIKVHGEDKALINLPVKTRDGAIPKFTIRDNVIEFTLDFAQPDERFSEKLDINAPHVLVRRIGIIPRGKTSAFAQVVVNGSLDNLKNRVHMKRTEDGIELALSFPQGATPTLDLLKDEQIPITGNLEKSTVESSSTRWTEIIISFVIALFVLVAGVFALKTLRNKGRLGGSRKYLVEQMSYCPIGQGGKNGVALVKVGNEFVLVGVTAQNINLISTLPKLEKQYEEEARFERGNFQEAVEQEYVRLRGSTGAHA